MSTVWSPAGASNSRPSSRSSRAPAAAGSAMTPRCSTSASACSRPLVVVIVVVWLSMGRPPSQGKVVSGLARDHAHDGGGRAREEHQNEAQSLVIGLEHPPVGQVLQARDPG